MSRWRPAGPDDLAAVLDIAARVHPAYPEAPSVFAERLALYPRGFLVSDGAGTAVGYAISHPGLRLRPPKLDCCLGRLPSRPDSYVIHDLALLPAAGGDGRGREAVRLLEAEARRAGLAELSLVAVNGSGGFWRGLGFTPVAPAPDADIAGYGPDALYMVRMLDPASAPVGT